MTHAKIFSCKHFARLHIHWVFRCALRASFHTKGEVVCNWSELKSVWCAGLLRVSSLAPDTKCFLGYCSKNCRPRLRAGNCSRNQAFVDVLATPPFPKRISGHNPSINFSMSIGLVSFQFFSFFTGMPGRYLWVNEKTEDNILKNISREFVTKDATENLASKLWDGQRVGGGSGFLSNRRFNGKPVDWSEMTYTMLRVWVGYYGKGSLLLAALQGTNPIVASKFTRQLLDNDGEKIVLICFQIWTTVNMVHLLIVS